MSWASVVAPSSRCIPLEWGCMGGPSFGDTPLSAHFSPVLLGLLIVLLP